MLFPKLKLSLLLDSNMEFQEKVNLKRSKQVHLAVGQKKSALVLLEVLKNAESNALYKNLNINEIFIDKIEVNRAVKGRRRTFRAHGKINNFNSNPCHVKISLVEREKSIPRSYSKNC